VSDESSRLAISAVSVAELKGRLNQEITNDGESAKAADANVNELTQNASQKSIATEIRVE